MMIFSDVVLGSKLPKASWEAISVSVLRWATSSPNFTQGEIFLEKGDERGGEEGA